VVTLSAEGDYYTCKRQDRGVLRICHCSCHNVLVTSSWDNSLRVYDTRCAADATIIVNENATVFCGVAYDAAAKQVRIAWQAC
jgi:hypothetical protein